MMNDVKTRPTYALILVIMLLGAGLRLQSAAADVRFHPDEALYSTYGRNAAVFGAWMLDGPVDKPPLSLYANALAQHLFAARITPQNVIDVPLRAGEFAAKLPNVYAGILALALIYTLAVRMYTDRRAALLGALLLAVAPYGIAYSASAFTDMLMLTLMLAAWVAAAYGQAGWAGALLALSICAKPQGIFYAPLILFHLRGRAVVALFPFSIVLMFLFLWDAIRPEMSLFTLGATNINQGAAWMPPASWGHRLLAWIQHGRVLLGVPMLTLTLGLLGIFGIYRRDKTQIWRGAMVLWCIGYVAAHIILAVPTFDRYLLPLIVPLVLLAAHSLMTSGQQASRRVQYVSALIIVLFAVSGQHNPRADVFRPAREDAFLHVAAWLNARPLGTIVYDHWLGHEMGYYMGAWTDKRRVYYPDASTQATDARLNPDAAPRYLLAPASADDGAWLDALRWAGFRVRLVYDCADVRLYELIPPVLWGVGALDVESSCPAAW